MLKSIFFLIFLLCAACSESQNSNNDLGGTSPFGGDGKPYLDIMSAGHSNCAKKENGQWTCWGLNHTKGYLTDFSSIATDFADPAQGDNDCYIRKSDLQPVCANSAKRGEAPYIEGGVKKIVLGISHACVIRIRDSFVQCWQRSDDARLPNPPTDLEVVTDLASGWDRVYAISERDQVLRYWGKQHGNDNGPSGSLRFSQISAYRNQYCAISVNGEPFCWGGYADTAAAMPGDLGKVKQIAVGPDHACAIQENNRLRCWQNSTNAVADFSKIPSDLGLVKKVAVGERNTCVLLLNDRLRCWSPRGLFNEDIYSLFPSTKPVARVSGYLNFLAIDYKDGTRTCHDYFGGDFYKFDGCKDAQQNIPPLGFTVPEEIGETVAVSVGSDHACAILKNSLHVKCWNYKDLENPDGSPQQQYGELNVPKDLGSVQQVLVHDTWFCAVKDSGILRCWGFFNL